MEARIPVIGDIRETRGNGGNRIVKDPESREPDKAKAAGIAAYANQNGLLLLTAGITGNMIRFLTPLVISDSLLNEGLSILEAGLRA